MANKLSGAFLLVFLPIISFGAVDPKWDRTPSPESYSLTKYGVVSPEMYTGAMSYSIPIFHYKDEDFDLPLSLDYHFDGFKPSTPTGVVGMGWYLNCGGVVTVKSEAFRTRRTALSNRITGREDICTY